MAYGEEVRSGGRLPSLVSPSMSAPRPVPTVPAYGRVLWLALLLVAFTVPFESATTLPLIGSAPRLLGGLTTLLFVASLALRRRVFTVALFGRLLLIYVFWAGLTLAWALNYPEARRRFFLLVQLVLFAILIVQVARTQRERAILATTYGLGSVVAGLIVISNALHRVTYLDQELAANVVVTRFNIGRVARYSIGNEDPNYVGMMLMIGIPMLLWGLWTLHQRRGVGMAMVLAPIVAYAALLTGSRGSTVLAPVVASVYVIVARGHRNVGRMLAGVVVAGLIGLVVWRHLPPDTQTRVLSGFDTTQSTSKLRQQAWRAGYHAFLRKPVQGYGLGSYQFAVRNELSRSLVAHNTYISDLVELGLVGLSLLGAVLTGIWRRGARLADIDRLFVRATLVLFMGSITFLSAELKKVTFFVLAMLVAAVTNRSASDESPASARSLDRDRIAPRR